MSRLRKTFRSIEIGDGGDGRWATHVRPMWPRAKEWMTDESRTAEGTDRARALFETHMPELVPVLERLARQLDRPGGETFLTLATLRPFTEAPDACAANHQHLPVPDDQERFSRTQERLSTVRAAGEDVAAMLKPPLYQYAYDEGLGTVYTAHYRPTEGRVTYHWPDESWEQSFTDFTPASRGIALGRAG